MAAIREISERAHVSPATVSKVLNGKGSVRHATRQMIPDIARELIGILVGKEPQQHTIMPDCTVIERESIHGTEETH